MSGNTVVETESQLQLRNMMFPLIIFPISDNIPYPVSIYHYLVLPGYLDIACMSIRYVLSM